MDLSEAPDPEQFNPDRARSIWREIPVAIGEATVFFRAN